MENAGYVAVAWSLTAAAVGGYALLVRARTRRAARLLDAGPLDAGPRANRPAGEPWR